MSRCIFPALLSLLLLTGCGSNEKRDDAESENDSVFVLSVTEPVETFDPVSIIYTPDRLISSFIYEGLVAIDENSGVIPLLAEHWKSDSSGTVWTFTLRDSVFFNDDPCFQSGSGRKLSAYDVVYSFKRIAAKENNSHYYSFFAERIAGFSEFDGTEDAEIKGLRALDSLTVEFTLTKPYVTFLKSLALPACYIIPPEAVIHYGSDFSRHPVGTGPFYLTLNEPLKKLTLLKNKRYWKTGTKGRNLPYLHTIECYVRPAETAAYIEFNKGKQHLLLCSANLFNRLQSDEDFTGRFEVITAGAGLSVRFLAFSMTGNSPFATDAGLRKTAVKNFDRNRLANIIPEHFIPAESLVPENLLKRKIGDYIRLPDEMSIVWDNVSRHKREVHIVSTIETPSLDLFLNNLQSAGFEPELSVQTVRYYEDISEKHPDIFRVSYKPVLPDPEEYYLLFYSKSEPSLNLSGFSNTQYDLLFEKAMIEQDMERRTNLFIELEKILATEAVFIPLTHEKEQYLIYPNYVSGIRLLSGLPDLRQVRINKKQ